MILNPKFPYPLYLVIAEKDCLYHPFAYLLEEAIIGGVNIVQLREKEATTEEFLAKAKAAKTITDRYGIPLIINDNIQVAKEIKAFGVHVGNSDTPPSTVRQILGDEACIGYSLEYWRQLATEESACANYLAASPVFSTATKVDTVTEWGLEGISKIRQATTKPIVAIGNIHLDNAFEIRKAGADSIAVVSEICASKNPRESAHLLKKAILKNLPS